MRVIIVGGGEIARKMALRLSGEKKDVVVIEKDPEKAESLAKQLDALVIHGDGTEKEILMDADAEKCDVFFAISDDDKTNLLAAGAAKALGIEAVVAAANRPENENAFRKAGVKVVSIADCIAKALQDAAASGDVPEPPDEKPKKGGNGILEKVRKSIAPRKKKAATRHGRKKGLKRK